MASCDNDVYFNNTFKSYKNGQFTFMNATNSRLKSYSFIVFMVSVFIDSLDCKTNSEFLIDIRDKLITIVNKANF